MFLQMGRALGSMLREVLLITTRTPNNGIARSLPAHWRIVETIRARDAEKACAYSRQQIQASRTDVTETLLTTPAPASVAPVVAALIEMAKAFLLYANPVVTDRSLMVITPLVLL